MIILSLDYSFAKSGYAITKIENGKLELIDCGLLVSDKELVFVERVLDHLNDIDDLVAKYNPDIIVKESAIMGRSSTGLPVIKAHGMLELYNHEYFLLPMEEIHNQSIKAWARKYMLENDILSKEQIKESDKKMIVANAVESYYSQIIFEMYTRRGRLLDDVSDAIAIGIVYYEKFMRE